MPQGRIARSWFRERNEAKSCLISPYILRGSPFFSRFKTQTRQNTEQKRLIQTRERLWLPAPGYCEGHGQNTPYQKGRVGGEGGSEGKQIGWSQPSEEFCSYRDQCGKDHGSRGPGNLREICGSSSQRGSPPGRCCHLSSRGISDEWQALLHPTVIRRKESFQTENASRVQQKTRSHQVKTQTRLSPRAACRFSTSLRIFNDLVGTTLVSYLACSNGFLIIISRLVLKISGKG